MSGGRHDPGRGFVFEAARGTREQARQWERLWAVDEDGGRLIWQACGPRVVLPKGI